ncbi:MAG: 2-hydroxy-3-oxopropionate reductase [Armatimonadota bacterium]|nr:2-hydroxy-3-oxopropionate reductase [Armatimonadota bacterium]
MGERIGFIGLGIMGRPMALNLRRAGYAVAVHNRSRGPVAELVAAGAADGRSPRGVAEASDIVITMLPDAPEVREVILGPGGVIEGARPGQLVVDMSTIAPSASREVAEVLRGRGIEALDAPVSGGQKGAVDGTLSIMVGGPAAAFARARPIFQAMGKNIVHIGETHGAGQVAKAANQIVVAVTIMAVAEALTLAGRAGVDPTRVREALMGGFAGSRILEQHGQRMLERNFVPGFRVRLHRKDLGIALAAGAAHGVPLFATALVHQVLGALAAQGLEDLDHSGIVRFVEQAAGTDGARPTGA